jgi:MarR family transcriptional regulator, lower aerobic nicotinate degradation pathway regulator
MLFADRPPEALSDQTGFLMYWLSSRSRAMFADRLEADYGMHPQQYGILLVIQGSPGLPQNAIGELASVDPSTLVATLDRLEQLGLAERRPHPADRRKRAIYLTSKGERVVVAARETAKEHSNRVYGALTRVERRELERLLRKLCGVSEPGDDGKTAGKAASAGKAAPGRKTVTDRKTVPDRRTATDRKTATNRARPRNGSKAAS